jgi:hypothetical protein|eukprot:Stramenopile-MAST_4_protein_1562
MAELAKNEGRKKFDSHLLQLREARRNVDRDAQLLANRIALLEAEEKKAWKKIQSTKERAESILATRLNNKKEKKEANRKIKLHQATRNLDAKYIEREVGRVNREAMQKKKDEQVRAQARAMKANKLKQEKLRREQDKELQRLNKARQEKIRKAKLEAIENRKRESREKMKKNKTEYDKKVKKEVDIKTQVESRVAKMERMEMELIQRLQNTQALQQDAYEQLETALNPRYDEED